MNGRGAAFRFARSRLTAVRPPYRAASRNRRRSAAVSPPEQRPPLVLHPRWRVFVLVLYSTTVFTSGLLSLGVVVVVGQKGAEGAVQGNGWFLLFSTAAFAHATGAFCLVFWAWKIRKSAKQYWIKATEVLREVTALYVISIVIGSTYSMVTPRWRDDVNQLFTATLVFFAVLLWTQTAGPGWTHYLEAREHLAGGPVVPKFTWLNLTHYEGHTFEFALLSSAVVVNIATLSTSVTMSWVWEWTGQPRPREYWLYGGFLVVSTFLWLRARSLRAATGALWAKGTQTARQVAVANLTFAFFDFIKVYLPENQAVSYQEIFKSVAALLAIGGAAFLVGPGRTAYVEAATAVASSVSSKHPVTERRAYSDGVEDSGR